MIIDNLKEFIAKFTGSHQENNDCVEENSELEEELVGDPISEEETEEEEIIDTPEEPLCGIPELESDLDYEDTHSPRIPDEEVNKPKPCVYGPPSWYINKSLANKPQPKVYGPYPDNR